MSSRLPPSSAHSIKFGHAQSTPPSKSSTFGQGRNDGVLEWLDYAECSLCRDPLLNGAAKGKHYWMTSCGHILCSSDEHQHQEGICTACNKQMELFLIQEGSVSAVLLLFKGSDVAGSYHQGMKYGFKMARRS